MKLVIDVLPSSMKHAPFAAPSNSLTWEAPAAAPLTGSRKSFVGDDKGWTLNFNYTAWAEVFKYPVGIRNIYKVDGPGFQLCNVPSGTEALTAGYDMITLATPGRKWYMCGKANGLPVSSDAPSSSPTWKIPTLPPSILPEPKQFIVGDNCGWTLGFNYTA
ncbi:uclacyanin 1-like [Asparagus officinalis]|uniref:uclacyanin 1-like n=1 Tax=Asparagus officinalis TaxID=4686 RepID=UPI00098E1854|nr:uclacyanin 1-like [Asparagus officinalis]